MGRWFRPREGKRWLQKPFHVPNTTATSRLREELGRERRKELEQQQRARIATVGIPDFANFSPCFACVPHHTASQLSV
jgi:hypothetical protein